MSKILLESIDIILPEDSKKGIGTRLCQKVFGNLLIEGTFLDMCNIYLEAYTIKDGKEVIESSISISNDKINEYVKAFRRFSPKSEPKKKKLISITRVS